MADLTQLDLQCIAIMELGQRRKFYIKTMNRLTNAAGAYIRTRLGWRYGIEEKEGVKIKAKAEKLLAEIIDEIESEQRDRDAEQRGKPKPKKSLKKAAKKPLEGEAAAIKAEITAFVLSLDPVIRERDGIVKEMERLAAKLPVAAWVDSIPGFSERGLAVIVGECGNLSNYTRDGLRKRLGLAPYNGKACSSWKAGGLTAEEWVSVGYSPRRRSQLHSFSDSMFRAQSARADKTDDETGEVKPGRPPIEPYGGLYYRRRERTAITHEDWTPAHSHMDALRVMTQRFIDDLRVEWIKRDTSALKLAA